MATSSTRRIKLLPEHLIDQIKAGEVVERPASLLKELLENSVDAGSSHINVHLVQNGLELLSIEDNGKGMYLEELPYAFARHATSKIARFEDLYSLASFGFRGEALASAASISRLTCTSAPIGDLELGGKIVLHGGQTVEEQPFKATSNGTSFYIRDLFYNTPARLKFIKSKTSEKNALKRIFSSSLLSHPEIEFSIKWDDADKKRYQKSQLATRVREVLIGKKSQASDLIMFEGQFDRTKIKGFLPLDPSAGSRSQQYLFVNHRLFTDKALHQVIMQSMNNFWGSSSAPYAVFIEVAPEELDVNVHPNKTQMKFLKMGEVVGVLKESIKRILPKVEKVEDASQSAQGNQHNANFEHTQLNYPQTSLKGHTGRSGHATQDHSRALLLGSRYFLFQSKYLLDAHTLLQPLRDELLDHQESDALPLLIATPLPKPEQWAHEQEEFYRLRGYDWEEIGSERIALKTLPSGIGSYPPHLVAKFLIMPEHSRELNGDVIELLHHFLATKEISDLSSNSYVELDDSSLGKLFL